MKAVFIVVLVAAMAILAKASLPEKVYYDVNNAPALFEKFIKDYNRHYKDEADKKIHYDEFVKSLHVINKANAENSGAVFDINNFADYTKEQRKNMFGLRRP